MRKKDTLIKVSQLNTASQNAVSPSGAASYMKNARQAWKQKKNTIIMKEMLKLRQENEELRKENLFLKKAAAFFAKEID